MNLCRTALSFLPALLAVWSLVAFPACSFDPSGVPNPSGDGDGATDDGGRRDARPEDGGTPDAYVPDAYVPDAYVPPCTGDTFECLPDGRARVCQNDQWTNLGLCPLGCDPMARACRVPSNAPPDAMEEGSGGIAPAAESPITINTNNGSITHASGTLRPADTFGVDPGSGIYFNHYPQSDGDKELGVFSMDTLHIGSEVEVFVVGSHPLVLLVDEDVTIEGVFHLEGAEGQAGAGGYAGGPPETAGLGSCPGQPGAGNNDGHGCTSGSGGGGHSSSGGAGGNAHCEGFTGGAGGSGGCGNENLIPLFGGSGGAGGSVMSGEGSTNPGDGGGGGGAIQITASGHLTISAGGINAGGGEGGQCTSAGGAGGGAGGAILLEAQSVDLVAGAVLAANGGGGGGGDCT